MGIVSENSCAVDLRSRAKPQALGVQWWGVEMDDNFADNARSYRGWTIEIDVERSLKSVSIHARLKRSGQPTLLVGHRVHGSESHESMIEAVLADVRQRIDEIEARR